MAVTGIAEARHDIGRLVQPLVDRGGEHSSVRRRFLHRRKAFRSCHHTEHGDIRCAAALYQADRVRHRPAGGQHRVKDDHRSAAQLVRERLQIRDRQVGFLVAGDTDESDLRLRDSGMRLVDHAEPGPQHRDQQRRIDQARPDRRRHRGADSHRLSRCLPAGFVDQHQREFAQRSAKSGRVGAFVTQHRQPGGGQRVVDDAHFHGVEGI
ncbi:hypothetical protein A5625_20860 [Mycobacterium sp. 1465703.0]|nr:hypothetical protein A5625_20860 [Mycobacterium sp. 1465703.0]